MGSEWTKKSSNWTKSEIDLGEDLLEKTAPGTRSRILKKSSFDIPEAIRSAQILIGEGLLDEAKKLLREVLRIEPENQLALSEQKKIQKTELDEILQLDPSSPRFEEIQSEEIVEKLKNDFDLEFSENDFSPEQDLYGSAGVDGFFKKIKERLKDGSNRDFLDLGISFFQMGLLELSMRLFQEVKRKSLSGSEINQNEFLESVYLLSVSLFQRKQYYQVLQELEFIVSDPVLSSEKKIPYFYLMARANESLKKYSRSIADYLEIIQIDPQYRDVEERLKKLESFK